MTLAAVCLFVNALSNKFLKGGISCKCASKIVIIYFFQYQCWWLVNFTYHIIQRSITCLINIGPQFHFASTWVFLASHQQGMHTKICNIIRRQASAINSHCTTIYPILEHSPTLSHQQFLWLPTQLHNVPWKVDHRKLLWLLQKQCLCRILDSQGNWMWWGAFNKKLTNEPDYPWRASSLPPPLISGLLILPLFCMQGFFLCCLCEVLQKLIIHILLLLCSLILLSHLIFSVLVHRTLVLTLVESWLSITTGIVLFFEGLLHICLGKLPLLAKHKYQCVELTNLILIFSVPIPL
jgi:hypothetical protein